MNIKELVFYWGKAVIQNNHPGKLVAWATAQRRFYRAPCREVLNMEKSADFEIYSIAYNNAELIRYQIATTTKFISDTHFFIVVDNSNIETESIKIRALCQESGTGYIRLPINPLRYSWSHILSLNYVWKHFVSKRTASFFGLLDHDIFPIAPTSILPMLKIQDVYGIVVDRTNWAFAGKAWSIPPWFAFFRKSAFPKMDFSLKKSLFPPYALDTGWAMYDLAYKKIDRAQLTFGSDEFVFEADGEFQHRFEFIADRTWFHITNAASALDVPSQKKMVEAKLAFSFRKLDQILVTHQ